MVINLHLCLLAGPEGHAPNPEVPALGRCRAVNLRWHRCLHCGCAPYPTDMYFIRGKGLGLVDMINRGLVCVLWRRCCLETLNPAQTPLLRKLCCAVGALHCGRRSELPRVRQHLWLSYGSIRALLRRPKFSSSLYLTLVGDRNTIARKPQL